MMYPANPNNSIQKVLASLVVIAAVVLLSLVAKAYNSDQKSPVVAVSSPSPAPSSPAANSSANPSQNVSTTSSYQDGTYSAMAYYYVPPGQESIGVSLTIVNGVVTDSSVQNSKNDPESARFQQDFASEYKNYVIGKKLSSLQLQYVAGASDTTQAFNAAVAKIRSQA